MIVVGMVGMKAAIDVESLCESLKRLGTIKAVADEAGMPYWRVRNLLMESCPEARKRRKKKAEEVRDDVCRMIKEGYGIQDIVEALDIGVGLAIALAKECGWVQRRTWRKMTEQERIEACRRLSMCWEEPGCQKRVAMEIGRSEATVSRLVRWCQQRGLLPL